MTSSGIPADFRADRTLGVGVELIRQLRRRRTQLALGFMVALPFVLFFAFSVGGAGGTGGTSFVALAESGAANFAVVTIFFSAGFLVLVVVSLFFGDTIAAEASWSSLRYLLAMPVPRLRLLRQKFLVAALLFVAALTVLSATAYLVGLVAYGSGPLAPPIGGDFSTRDGLLRLGVVIGYVAVQLSWVAGLAFLLSVLTDAPLGAVCGAVLVAIVSQILDQIEALGGVRLWLPTHYGPSWSGALVDPIRWDDMVRGVFTGLAYAFILVLLSCSFGSGGKTSPAERSPTRSKTWLRRRGRTNVTGDDLPTCAAGPSLMTPVGPGPDEGEVLTHRRQPGRTDRRDVIATCCAFALIAAAAAAGQILLNTGTPMQLNFPPLLADQQAHVGPGTPLAVGMAVAGVVHGPRLARRLHWNALLGLAYAAALTWTMCLALVDGYQRGWAGRLSTTDEYLHDLPRISSAGDFIGTFTDHIVDFQPGSWTTHVSSHPPLATLVFWGLDRVGLRGGGWAGLLVMVVGSSACIAVAVTVKTLGSTVGARRALPFLVFFPGAVWIGVSADGLFAGVGAWGIALGVLGVRRVGLCGALLAAFGGLLLGATLYLSYGLALLGFVVLAACWLTVRGRPDWRPVILRWACVAGGVGLVVATFTSAGFTWLEGLRLLKIRYYQGVAGQRPYLYFVWANLAALCLSAGPLVAAGLGRALPMAARKSTRTASPVVVLAAAAFLAVLVADLTGLSKAETERIWLPFAVWMLGSLALIPPRATRWALSVQVVLALLVNHLLVTNW